MSFRLVRQSKFRHVYGTCLKREQCFDNIRVSKSSWDSTFCAVNPKFCAIIVESGGGGAFIVLPLTKINKEGHWEPDKKGVLAGRIPADHPLVGGHKGPVLDIAWDPFNDNVIASGSEDCVVKVWQIPDIGLVTTMTEPVVDLAYHQRRVGLVLWHPTANNVLLSGGSDNLVIIWNVGVGEALIVIDSHPDIIYSASFNWNGSYLITTCKDKKIRLIDPRTGEIEEEAPSHEGSKATRAIFLRNSLIFTTGFSKRSERQYSLRAPGHLDDPITMVELDTSNGVMFPMYDPDTNIIYLCGKGDSVIRYFEVTPEVPFVHYINTFQLADTQRGIGMMCKRGCDVNACEITRFYRLNNNGFCQIVTMTVPRKSELFQEDLYPDTPGDIPALSAEEWWSGKDSDPIVMSLKGGYTPVAKSELKVTKKSNILDKMPPTGKVKSEEDGKATAVSAEALEKVEEVVKQNEELKKRVDELQAEMKKFKAVFLKQENRIRNLESKLSEKTTDTDQQTPEKVAVTSSYKIHSVRKKASVGYVVHASEPAASKVNNNVEMAPDEV
ncbi:protein coronin isoform X2 [Oratosquilla oratoria]|uniref:protein coronin isoform X2 n=1 Tax=Oratosquilla oratoria TaxID=337810 RepID=UPI003F759CD6